MPTVVSPFHDGTDKDHQVIIGVDPHKLSHTATVVDPLTNTAVTSLRVDASLPGYGELLRWARQFPERRWAIENAKGLGCHLAQWLVARDEVVFDVATTATARVRELSRGGRRKNDVIDASAAASVAALQGDAHEVAAEDHTTLFALLEERRANLAAQRVRAVNQLHALMRDLTLAVPASRSPPRSPPRSCGPCDRPPDRTHPQGHRLGPRKGHPGTRRAPHSDRGTDGWRSRTTRQQPH